MSLIFYIVTPSVRMTSVSLEPHIPYGRMTFWGFGPDVIRTDGIRTDGYPSVRTPSVRPKNMGLCQTMNGGDRRREVTTYSNNTDRGRVHGQVEEEDTNVHFAFSTIPIRFYFEYK